MKRILVAEVLDQEGIDLLRAHFEVDTRDSTSVEELTEIIPNYDGLVVWTYTHVPRQVIDRAEKLKVIARAGIGLDKVDVKCAESRGIVVRNTPEGNTLSVAEMVLAMMLTLARRLIPADRYVRSRSGWDRGQFTGNELSEKTLGIIGLGNVGKKVAKRALAFEMRLRGFDPFLDADQMAGHGVEKVDTLDALLPQADFVTIHLPLTDATRDLIGKRELNMMKRNAFIINTSRGPIIDQGALLDSLKKGRIAGAGLDVFDTEPPEDIELLGLENVVVTPHVAGTTHEALRKMAVQAARIIIDQLKG